MLLYGSSNKDHICGFTFCHQLTWPFTYASSKPNFLATSSSEGFSVSKSNLSKTASVSWVFRCCILLREKWKKRKKNKKWKWFFVCKNIFFLFFRKWYLELFHHGTWINSTFSKWVYLHLQNNMLIFLQRLSPKIFLEFFSHYVLSYVRYREVVRRLRIERHSWYRSEVTSNFKRRKNIWRCETTLCRIPFILKVGDSRVKRE